MIGGFVGSVETTNQLTNRLWKLTAALFLRHHFQGGISSVRYVNRYRTRCGLDVLKGLPRARRARDEFANRPVTARRERTLPQRWLLLVRFGNVRCLFHPGGTFGDGPESEGLRTFEPPWAPASKAWSCACDEAG